MSYQEIILHTLFESGSSKVQDLERYIFEDVDRYGTRLGELDKKLVSAYRETVRDYAFWLVYGSLIRYHRLQENYWKTKGYSKRKTRKRPVLLQCAFFFPTSQLLLTPHSSGEFADILGEDYLGLRELGIAAEFGMSNLSIPKRLLKGKKGQNKPTACVLSASNLMTHLILFVRQFQTHRTPTAVSPASPICAAYSGQSCRPNWSA